MGFPGYTPREVPATSISIFCDTYKHSFPEPIQLGILQFAKTLHVFISNIKYNYVDQASWLSRESCLLPSPTPPKFNSQDPQDGRRKSIPELLTPTCHVVYPKPK